MSLALTAQQAWAPLPPAEWNADAARHLLRRAGWTARREEVVRATAEGLAPTLERLFPSEPATFPMPRLVARFQESAPALQRELATATGDEKLRRQRELQERARIGIQELSVKWLEYAAAPATSAVAKWTLFLSDVYVVAADKVRNPVLLHQHFDILGRHGFGSAPALTKAVSRSPAMVIYLDLAQSQPKAPNENFARELFELFVLGEGNYTEADIKEAARAFTGYRARFDGVFRFDARQHDAAEKTIFGQRGRFTGDDVIDLAYRQPAAERFLPAEMIRFYLSDVPLPAAHVSALGETWRTSGFDLRKLLHTFFGSRAFFAPEFRGNFIKSPVQFYLGVLQDFDLEVAPLPRFTIAPLRQMGQALFYPPNVRGWVGGRQWINAATLNARRQFVESVFAPLDENSLNADEQLELVAARSNGRTRFVVADDALAFAGKAEPAELIDALASDLLGANASPDVRASLASFIASGPASDLQRTRRLRRAAVTLLQSPEYQLC